MTVEQLVLSLDIPVRLQIVAWVTITEAQAYIKACKNEAPDLPTERAAYPFLKILSALTMPSEDYRKVKDFLFADSELLADA